MKIVITVKDTDNVIGLKEDIAMRLEGVADIVRIDTADVVPKSEVEKLERTVKYLEGVCESLPDKVKAEVSREIFEDIENVIDNELQNNYKVLPQFEFSNELWNKMSGRIEALKEICDFIAELKKKYTKQSGE